MIFLNEILDYELYTWIFSFQGLRLFRLQKGDHKSKYVHEMEKKQNTIKQGIDSLKLFEHTST